MRTAITYFSYKDNFDMLTCSISVARQKLPSATIFVFDDANQRQMNHAQQQRLKELNVIYKSTTFFRRGNLLGQESLKGMAEEWNKIWNDFDIVIKIDSDTFLLKTDWLTDWFENYPLAAMAGATSPDTPYYPQGPCYAIRSQYIPLLLDDIKTYPAWYSCWEDYEIGYRIARITARIQNLTGNEADAIYRIRHQADLVCMVPVELEPKKMEILENVSVYSVDFYNDPRPKPIINQIKSSYMAAFVEYYFRTNLQGENNDNN